jgi:hypothetical protein
MKFIFEMAIYCGRMKEWRILNITTGSVYSMSYDTEADASKNIEDGKVRAGCRVVRVTRADVQHIFEKLELSV